GGDRSGVTGGTRVLSDRILVRITAGAGKSFLDRMIALVEGAIRQRTPNEIALSLVLSAFTLIFLIVTAALWPMALYAELYMKDYPSPLPVSPAGRGVGVRGAAEPVRSLGTDVPTLVALLVCLIPTTIGALVARAEAMVPAGARFVEFTAQTRMSGVDLPDGRVIRKGAPDAVVRHVQRGNGRLPDGLQQQVDAVASGGATPLLVCEGTRVA